MSYATIADYTRALTKEEAVQASNADDPDDLAISRPELELALLNASNRIDSRLAGRFAIPIEPAPPTLTRICVRIARWELDGINGIREHVQTQYDAALKDLDDIATGAIALLDAEGEAIVPVAGPDAVTGEAAPFAFVANRPAPKIHWAGTNYYLIRERYQ